MAQAWQTLEEASLTLGISLRTLHRRLARNEFETRLENGRREVLVILTEPQHTPEQLAAAAEAVASLADVSAKRQPASEADSYSSDDYGQAIDTVADEVQQTMLALHEDRIRRTDLAIMAYQQSVNVAAADARRAVTRSRIAWGVAGGVTVGLFLAVTWATHTVTKANAEVSHLSDNVRQLTATVDVKSNEIKELRTDSQASRLSAARAEGELAAAKSQIDQLRREREVAEAKVAAQVVAAPTVTLPAAPTTQPLAVTAAATQPAATTQPARN